MNLDLGHINKVSSVSVVITDEGYYFDVLNVVTKKKELKIASIHNRIKTVDELIKVAGKYSSFILHFSGKGVLNKKLKNTPNFRQKMLFDTNFDDFYFTDVINQEYVFCSMIRKNVANDIINQFNLKLNHVISIASGPFISTALSDILKTDSLQTKNYILQLHNKQLIDFTKNKDSQSKNYYLSNTKVKGYEIYALAHSLVFFKPNKQIVLPQDSTIETLKEETKQKNIFIRFGAAMLLFFLSILMGNMIYLNVLNKKISNNYSILAASEQNLSLVTVLTEEKNRKEKILNSSGLLSKQFLTFYLKEITNSVPSKISFNNIELKPITNEIRNNFKIEIDEKNIYIEGVTVSSNLLSKWIKKLEEKEWTGKIDIINYYFSKGIGEFELKIEIINV